jgi:hypothetical protein
VLVAQALQAAWALLAEAERFQPLADQGVAKAAVKVWAAAKAWVEAGAVKAWGSIAVVKA